MSFWKARDAGATPEGPTDVRAGVIRRPRTVQRDAGSGVKTREHGGVRDHVR